MSYKFEKLSVGGFWAFASRPRVGDVHLKRFVSEGVTPANQATLNLYSGRFLFSIPTTGFEQVLEAGQSSLDLHVGAYPAGEVCEETPLADGSLRFCLSPVDPAAKWARRLVVFGQGGGQIAVRPGSAVFVADGVATVDGVPAACHVPVSGRSIVCEAAARIIVSELAP